MEVLGGQCSEVTDAVERLCGRPHSHGAWVQSLGAVATSVEKFVREHASAFL